MTRAVAVPTVSVPRKAPLWLAIPVAAAVVIGGAVMLIPQGPQGGPVGSFHTVQPTDLTVTIGLNGELAAVTSTEIYSQVEGSTTLQWIIKEGTFARQGDVLVRLDDSAIRQKIEDTTLEVQKSEADVTTAREMLEIQRSENTTNLESAQVALQLAQLDLTQYTQGTYPQLLANAQTAVEMAQITLDNKEADFRQVNELAAKGYLTPTDVKLREIDLRDARNKLSKAQTDLEVLVNYTHQMDLTSKKNTLVQAERRLVRTQRENAAREEQKEVDLRAKEQSLAVQRRRLENFKKQFEACTIRAPHDGLVVYATSGDRNAQNQIQEGATIRERQAILRLPETDAMKAVIRVPEAVMPKIEPGLRASIKIVGIPEPLQGTVDKVSVLADSGSRWWNPDVKEYPVDIVLDETPPNLKPGITAEVQVYVASIENTLAVPQSSIYSSGPDRYVFVRSGDDAAPRKVTVGSSNDSFIAVTDGLRDGDEVLILKEGQGRALLAKAGIAEAPQQRGDRPGRRREGGPGNGAPGNNEPGNNEPGKNGPAGGSVPATASAEATTPVADGAAPTTRPARQSAEASVRD